MDEATAVPDGPRAPGGPGRGEGGGRVRTGDTGRIEDALTAPLIEAVRDLGGYGGLVYLRSRDRRSLVLAMVTGVPRSLLRAWWRVPVGGALPMAEAYRRDETLWLPDERVTMVRFPHFTAGLPYSFGSAYQPVRAGGEAVGVLVVLRSAARSSMDAEAVDLALHPARRDVEERLGRLAADRSGSGSGAYRLEYDDEPVSVRLPTAAVQPVRVGLIDWDLDSDRCTPDDEALALLGIGRAEFGGTMAAVEARVSPDDLHELRASRQDALTAGSDPGTCGCGTSPRAAGRSATGPSNCGATSCATAPAPPGSWSAPWSTRAAGSPRPRPPSGCPTDCSPWTRTAA
jgi:uncharacterized low-complexity protein